MRIEIYKDGLGASGYKSLNNTIKQLNGEQFVNLNKNQVGFWRFHVEVTFHDFYREHILETLKNQGCTVYENKVKIIENTMFDELNLLRSV